MFKTEKQFHIAKYSILIVPIILGGLLYKANIIGLNVFQGIFVLSLTTALFIWWKLMAIKLKDNKAFKLMTLPYARLSHYEVKDRKFFISNMDIENYIIMAHNNGIRLEVDAEKMHAKAIKPKVAAYRNNTDKP